MLQDHENHRNPYHVGNVNTTTRQKWKLPVRRLVWTCLAIAPVWVLQGMMLVPLEVFFHLDRVPGTVSDPLLTLYFLAGVPFAWFLMRRSASADQTES
ncbi:MAG: hypothetical protein JNL58_21435 [Planctomyces sp.]|nr:hypothetical protein [Planctomyces sp.]